MIQPQFCLEKLHDSHSYVLRINHKKTQAAIIGTWLALYFTQFFDEMEIWEENRFS